MQGRNWKRLPKAANQGSQPLGERAERKDVDDQHVRIPGFLAVLDQAGEQPLAFATDTLPGEHEQIESKPPKLDPEIESIRGRVETKASIEKTRV